MTTLNDQSANPERWRVVLIEGENLLRTTLARAIHLNERFRLMADFSEIDSARDVCRRLEPELLIIDVDFAPAQSISFVEILMEQQPGTRVLVISASHDPAMLHQISEAKPHGFVPRDESIDIFEEAMAEVVTGHRYFPASFVRDVQFKSSLPENSSWPAD